MTTSEHLFTKRVLSFSDQNLHAAQAALRGQFAALPNAQVWGLWQGVFGVAAHQLVLVSAHQSLDDGWQAPADCTVEAQWRLKATARPQTTQPLTRSGIYVFRDFWLPYVNIGQAVELSSAAWQTFEGADAYSAEPMGLFAPAEPLRATEECVLHLLTWYPNFAAWETSRQPDEQAMQRFKARRALTRTTAAVATRLLLAS
ncbi:MAG: hypothetical protein GWP70_00330 [Proteobacteria bacterium]|nr:hypothetical protein [Pseudomonadota bacterium]